VCGVGTRRAACAVLNSEVPELRRSLQTDLLGLLDSLQRWANTHCPDGATALVAHADHVFEISAAVKLSARIHVPGPPIM
jgi:hypothetical protein